MNEEIFIPILLGLGLFATIFGVRYLQNQENMLMIQSGMDPGIRRPKGPTFTALKIGLLLIGAGLGLFTAFLLDNTIMNYDEHNNNPSLYFSLIAVFGGIGLFISHLIEMKESKKN
jgi:uncharacterized membrane protein YbhN (UPF0104 family)